MCTDKERKMKFALFFLVVVAVYGAEAYGTHANAQMFLAGTNDFIGTINFYVEEEAWVVVITGSVDRLRPLATLVSLFPLVSFSNV
jgi:hypothetical protein